LDKKLQSEIISEKRICICKLTVPNPEWDNHISICREYLNNINKNIQNIIVKEVKEYLNLLTI